MTKHELLLSIYQDYDIEDMIKRNIHQSELDESYKDLYQEIYLILFELSFGVLWRLKSTKTIPHYITGIIKNQRQSIYLDWRKNFKVNDYELIEDNIESIEDETITDKEIEMDEQINIINYVLHKKYPLSNLSAFTYIENAEFFCIEIYKIYLRKKYKYKYSFTKLSKELNINRNLISDSIQTAKQIIRKEWKKQKPR